MLKFLLIIKELNFHMTAIDFNTQVLS